MYGRTGMMLGALAALLATPEGSEHMHRAESRRLRELRKEQLDGGHLEASRKASGAAGGGARATLASPRHHHHHHHHHPLSTHEGFAEVHARSLPNAALCCSNIFKLVHVRSSSSSESVK